MTALAERVCLKQIFRLTVRCRNAQFASGLVVGMALANSAYHCGALHGRNTCALLTLKLFSAKTSHQERNEVNGLF